MAGVVVMGGLLSALLGCYALKRKTTKPQAMPIHMMGGEPGLTMRNHAFATLVEIPWEGATTLAALFEQTCNLHASQKLLGTREFIGREVEARPDGKPLEKVAMGSYVWTSYARAFERACNFASGLVALGHQKGERCAIFAQTRADWFIALQGCFRRNFTVVTIYDSLGDDALVHSLNETQVTTLICDRRQMKKLAYLSEQLGKLRRVVYMEELGETSEPLLSDMPGSLTFVSFSKVESLGQEFSLQPDLPVHSDIAIIMYTSGSTGLPKGVMMTHANMVATVSGILHTFPALCSKDVYMAFLPLAHVFELVAECIMCVAGASIGYGSPLTLTDTSSKIKKGTRGDASELMPTIISSVPAILDRVRNGVTKTVEAKGGISKKLFEMAYKRRLAAIEGSWFGAWGLEKLLWDALVFKKIKLVLGGRVRFIISGGAPLSRDTQRFINICIGTPIGQGYGLTETCAGATFSSMDDTTVGRVGPPSPQCYVKLINWNEGGYTIEDTPMPRGEIVIGGPNVTLGYFNNQAKTDEVYKVYEKGVRWFYTGDIGKFHPDGCLEIIDRKKDIVKLQHGEYLSPGKVEAILVGSQYVESMMVHADPFHSYAVALVVASQPALESWARDKGIPHKHFHDLCLKDEAVEEIISSLQKVGNNAKLQKIEIPTKIKLLSEPWTPENGLVTAALKLKRENIRKAFLNDLKALYTGTSKSS